MTHDTNKDNLAAITIQKNMRGFLAKKKYGIKPLKERELENYLVFPVGNDPKMPPSLDKYNEPNEEIGFIGTSGMRSLSLACKLGNPKHPPKIIIVDNSKEVYEFWDAMRKFVKEDKKAGTADLFLANLPRFLILHRNLYRHIPDDAFAQDVAPGVTYLNQNIATYFKALINKHGYGYVRSVILHTSLIKQSWAEPTVFVKLKNILRHQGINKIYMYPSNIVACIDDPKIRAQVLDNILKTNPLLSIHTDLCGIHGHPEKVFLFENNDPKQVSHTLFAPSTCIPTDNDGLDLHGLIYLLNKLRNTLNSPTLNVNRMGEVRS